MFKFLTRFARDAQDGMGTSTTDALRHHAPLYCAARNVYLTAETAFTALDADRLHCALSELRKLAAELGSPARDLAEMAEWCEALGARVTQLRMQPSQPHRDAASLEVFISRGVVAHEQQRRASA